MKCYNHHHINAVSTCDCGKALCSECTTKYGTPLCDTCAQTYLNDIKNEEKSYYIKCYIFMVILFILGLLANESLFAGLIVGCVPWGWRTLNKITPNIFLSMSWAGWLAYFMIKCCLSAMIGIFMAPFQIYKSIQVFKS